MNLLRRINRELGGDARLGAWRHEARVFEDRVEMHLVSETDQTLTVCGEAFRFPSGVSIHTETSTKFGPDALAAVASRAGLTRSQRWTDPRGWFAVELYIASAPSE